MSRVATKLGGLVPKGANQDATPTNQKLTFYYMSYNDNYDWNDKYLWVLIIGLTIVVGILWWFRIGIFNI